MQTKFSKRIKITLSITFLTLLMIAQVGILNPDLFKSEIEHNKRIESKTITPDNSMEMNFDFTKAWQEIDSLVDAGLPKSALEKTIALYHIAKRENNAAHLVKSLIYRGRFLSELEEDGFIKSIDLFQMEIQTLAFPANAILQSALAELYDNYLNDNFWKIEDRTEILNYEDQSIDTWTAGQLIDKSSELYLSSIKDDRLKTVSSDDFRSIFSDGENTEGLRPTLFDLLAHRSIDYFMNEKSQLTQPVYMFQISDAEAYATVNEFLRWKPVTADSSSRKLATLKIFQEWLSFRFNDIKNNPAALVDVDLKRLGYVHDNATIAERNELYLQSLEDIRKPWVGKEAEADILVEIARHYQSNGHDYIPNPIGSGLEEPATKWHYKKAADLCTEVMKLYPETFAAKRCAILLGELRARNLEIKTEEVNLPNKSILGKLDYRNTKKVWMKLIPVTTNFENEWKQLRKKDHTNEDLIKLLNSQIALESWSVDLPDDGDLRSHSAEFKINKQALGQYILMASSSHDFRSDLVTYLPFTVSRIGYWERRSNAEGLQFVVFDRESGAPLKGVTAHLYIRSYNSASGQYEEVLSGKSVSDSEGFIDPRFNRSKSNTYKVVFEKGKDKLDLDQSFYEYQQTPVAQPYSQTTFFLDRAIYRPGQTIFFKGIALEFDVERMPSIQKNKDVTVTLRDANWQEVTSLKFKTNEYGTFNGSFTAPKSGLPGQMSLVSDHGGQSKSFQVEEYRRPKFEVTFEPVKGNYRLNEKVNLTGKATAYAGNNIDGAQVVWRVERRVHYPWMPWWRMSWYPIRSSSMEIANGITKTSDSGTFEIDFDAIPDPTVLKKTKPLFTYVIYADVTDQTGETRSGEIHVLVGYTSLLADFELEETISKDSLSTIKILTTNLSGQAVPAKGEIKLEKLKQPNKTFISRYWGFTDRAIMSEDDFEKHFPNVPWQMEDVPANWPIEKTSHTGNFDTGISSDLPFQSETMKQLKPGWYVLRLNTMDVFGEKVEVDKYFRVYEPDKGKFPGTEFGWYDLEKTSYEPGEFAVINFAGSGNKLHVLLEIEKEGRTIDRQWLKICGQDSYKKLIEDSHRGNLSYTVSYAGLNRSTNDSKTIFVPWSNKELKIELNTFRDKLYPGQDEEWSFKISGPKGEKIAAEMVASMYDASLDAFAANSWSMYLYPSSWHQIQYRAHAFRAVSDISLSYFDYFYDYSDVNRIYPSLQWFGWYSSYPVMYDRAVLSAAPEVEMMKAGREQAEAELAPSPYKAEVPEETIQPQSVGEPLKVRTNLNETVFFYPNLMTDANGNVFIKFKMNEALTKWKFLGLAHTKNLEVAAMTKEVVTQKELMVVPNPPRFFRELDEIEFTAKVVNLSNKPLSGNAQLQLINPLESMPVYKWEDNPQFNVNFRVEPGQSTGVAWRFRVPEVTDVPLIEHTVVAAAGDFSDAERSTAPVISNRMLVTETLPLPVRGNQTREFVFKSLQNNQSATLRNHRFTLEFTQNPAWYAVQALPYLMEYPYDCNEQIFSRYYANSLASTVANSHPSVKGVFDRWRSYEPDALLSNLSKNQELKSALLAETPWVLQAKNEEQQKQQIALLFDLNKMSYEAEQSLSKLAERQMPSGGWAWFQGGPDSWYITQYIVEGLGHMHKLGVTDLHRNPTSWQMTKQAIQYCDDKLAGEFEHLQKQVELGRAKWEDDHLSYLIAHYLYMRSFFIEDKSVQNNTGNLSPEKSGTHVPVQGKALEAFQYYLGQAEKYWLNKGMYTEGLLALALHRTGKSQTSNTIVKSLKERSLKSEEMGIYWKYPSGYWWYTAPIETHSLMIEVFNDVAKDKAFVEELKVWLLKNKQTNHWKTTKATASAVYALLLTGDNWLLESTPLDISFSDGSPTASGWLNKIKVGQVKAEAGTGYFKTNFGSEEIEKGLAKIKVRNPNNVASWGAAYWQYFEQLDKITTFAETPLSLKKQVYVVENTSTGEALKKVSDNDKVKVGQKLMIRVELRVDRDMEYIHLKDMRASGLEPINVISSYKWQGGLGYYESTRDASTDFFISWLPKGTYVFEYPLRVVHRGDFSNGVTTIQCMYAPEFSSHSQGIRLKVE